MTRPPFSIAPHATRPIALACDSPHSGTAHPEDFGHDVALTELRQREDTHVEAVWAGVPLAGGSMLHAHFPRSYLLLPIYSRRLGVAEVSHRIETCWRPYREVLRSFIGQVRTRFRRVWHLNLRSMLRAHAPRRRPGLNRVALFIDAEMGALSIPNHAEELS